MQTQQALKRLHASGTFWFLTCALYLLAIALHEANFKWWVVFSFSGYSLFIFLLLLNVYIYAIFRGVTRTQNCLEHPLTTSAYYVGFYDLCPFLGGLAGLICSFTLPELGWIGVLSTVAEGTLSFTFIIWIVFDPIIGFIETLSPQSAHYRKERLAAQAEEKRHKELEKQRLLEDLEQKEAENLQAWNRALEPLAEQTSVFLCNQDTSEQAKRIAIQAGAKAWQLGGLLCMKHLHQMVLKRTPNTKMDYLAFWWDGIGAWRKPSVKQVLKSCN